MAAIGSVWGTGTWTDDVWGEGTWGDAQEAAAVTGGGSNRPKPLPHFPSLPEMDWSLEFQLLVTAALVDEELR